MNLKLTDLLETEKTGMWEARLEKTGEREKASKPGRNGGEGRKEGSRKEGMNE